MNDTEQKNSDTFAPDESPGISLSHFVHTITKYRHTILVSLAAVAIGYGIVAILLYLLAPSQQITSQQFRLDFEGATQGHYPNGSKFGIADVISGPNLQRVHRDNQLDRLISFRDFSHSIFVLESNAASEQLAAEYQARLADQRLSPVDRERIQNEYELKRQSLTKNEYSINFLRRAGLRTFPEPLARKNLLDVLNGWADLAINQQHVLTYRISVLSPEILKLSSIETTDPIAAIEVLRAKTNRVLADIKRIEQLPGGELVRTPADHLSLTEVSLRLEEIVRFRLDPLVPLVKEKGLISDPAATTRFVQTQLAYDQRELQAKQAEAESLRQAITVYEQPSNTAIIQGRGLSTAERGNQGVNSGSETVMPQLSDTFLDRLLALTNRAADAQYRQRLVDEYRQAVAATIPVQQAVAYDTEMLSLIRNAVPGKKNGEAAEVRQQIDDARTEVGHLIEKTNELYQLISRNMTPSPQLFTLTSTPMTRTVRSYSLSRMVLYGLLVLLMALPVIILICLLHNRVREEEAAEHYPRSAQA